MRSLRFCKPLLFALVLPFCAFAGAADLNAMLSDCLASGKRVLQLPDGDLRVDSPFVLDASASGVKILGGKNTRLVFTQLADAIFLNGCRDVVLKGFAIDYDPLCFTQGSVTAIDGARISFKIHEGYPSLTKPYLVKHALLFSKETRNWLWDSVPNHTVAIEAADARNGVLTLAVPPQNLKLGDFVCLNFRDGCAVKLRGLSGEILFEDIDILSAPSGFIFRRSSGSLTFKLVRILRGPTPPGAAEPRLLAASADGINIAMCRQGPLIEDCDFSFMGDDSVNLHGEALPVVSADQDGFVFLQGYKPVELLSLIQPGDKVRLLTPSTYAPEGFCEVSSIESVLPGSVSPDALKKLYPAMSLSTYSLFRVKAKGALPKPGQFVDIPALNSPGYVIRNSRFHDHRARGLRLLASNGAVDSCSFWNLEQSAVSLGPEYEFWREAGWVSNVAVSNCDIKDVCLGSVSVSQYSYFPGAIAVIARSSKGFGYPSPANSDLSIAGNRISNCGAAAVFVNSARNVSVKGNVYSGLWLLEGSGAALGSEWGVSIKREAFPVMASEKVNIEGNREEAPTK